MKFSQNTSVMEPNTINAQARGVSDPMAYGTGGKGLAGLSGALGQAIKFAKDQQDDRDAAKVLEGRTEIINAINQQLYGEDGIMITGVGKNAQGLSDRVTKTIQDTVDKVSRNYNPRVQKTLKNNLSEPLSGYQRQAIQQEGREFEKQKDTDLTANLSFNYDRIIANYAEDGTISMTLNDSLNLLQYRARDKGWSGMQLATEQRKLVGTMIGGAIQTAIDDGNLPKAGEILNTYGSMMDQTTRMKYNGIIKKDTNIRMTIDMGSEVLKNYGKDKNAAHKYVYEYLAKQTETVSGGGGGAYFSDTDLNNEIMAAAKEFNVDPALVAAVAQAESNGRQSAVSGVGALGVMQLMPDTADSLGVDPNNRKDNIRGGAKYLRQMLDTFGGDVRKAVAAYNAGPGAVKQYGGVPPYKETQNYVAKILDGTQDSGEAFYSKYKNMGNVRTDKLDDGIDASGVDLTGTKPRTIGMINYAHKLYKQLTGKDDFWVSCTTGGHASDTAHGRGDGADVGGSGLKDPEILKKFLAGMRAVGAGANDEYNYKSKGWTGPHVDLKADGDNWQTGEKLGGFNGGGGSTYTKPKYTQAQLDAIWRQYEAQLTDSVQTEEYAKKQELEAVRSQIENTSSSSEALAILQRLRATPGTDTSKLDVAIHAINSKYPGAVSSARRGTGTGTGGGSRRTKERIPGENGHYGKSGKWYPMDKFNEAEKANEEYKRLRALSDAGLYVIGDRQKYFNNMAEITNDVYDNNYTDIGMIAARKAFDQSKGDIYKATVLLMENAGMDQAEAARYIDHYLNIQRQNREEE